MSGALLARRSAGLLKHVQFKLHSCSCKRNLSNQEMMEEENRSQKAEIQNQSFVILLLSRCSPLGQVEVQGWMNDGNLACSPSALRPAATGCSTDNAQSPPARIILAKAAMEAAGADDKYPVRVQCEGCQALLEVRLAAHRHTVQPPRLLAVTPLRDQSSSLRLLFHNTAQLADHRLPREQAKNYQIGSMASMLRMLSK